jgi:hypothetical protein
MQNKNLNPNPKIVSVISKETLLKFWNECVEPIGFDEPIYPEILKAATLLPLNHHGSKFGHDGIRIEGSKKFIASVLYQLRQLLEIDVDMLEINANILDLACVTEPLNAEKEHIVMYIRIKNKSKKYDL